MPRQTGGDQPPCIAVLECRGHPNVALTHRSTLEFEEADTLTPRGDCIACISCKGGGAARRCAEQRGLALAYIVAFNPWSGLRQYRLYGFSPGLKPGRLIVRKSQHRRDSIIIGSPYAAADVPRELVELLRSPFTRCMVLYAVLPVELTAAESSEEPPQGDDG